MIPSTSFSMVTVCFEGHLSGLLHKHQENETGVKGDPNGKRLFDGMKGREAAASPEF